MRYPTIQNILAVSALLHGSLSAAIVVNADFSRDISANNVGNNPAPVLYTGTGPALDAGTTWNDLQVPLAADGDSATDPSIAHPVQFSNLVASNGTATTIEIQLTSGFFRSFNGAAATASTVAALQNDRVFANSGNLATLTIQGLNPNYTYDLFFINSGGFTTAYTIGATSKVATGNTYDGTWTEGGEFASFTGISSSLSGEISVGIRDGVAPIDGFGTIAGLQIVEI